MIAKMTLFLARVTVFHPKSNPFDFGLDFSFFIALEAPQTRLVFTFSWLSFFTDFKDKCLSFEGVDNLYI